MGYLCLRVPAHACPCVDVLLQNDQDKRGTARRHSAATATFFHVEMLHSTWLKVKKDSAVLMLGILFSFPSPATSAALGLTLSCADFVLKCHRAEKTVLFSIKTSLILFSSAKSTAGIIPATGMEKKEEHMAMSLSSVLGAGDCSTWAHLH